MNYAKFVATLGKTTMVDPKTLKIEMTMSLKASIPFLEFFANKQKQELNVAFGDPQMSFEFEHEADERDRKDYFHRQGVSGKIDQHGIVQTERDLFSAQIVSNHVENSDKTDENVSVDPYAGKVVVLLQEDTDNEIKYIFSIVNGQAALPARYINGEFDDVATFEEVIEEIGLLGVETDGVMFYKIEELIAFGGHLRDSDTVLLEGNKVAYPDYYGKEIVISKEDAGDLIAYVFPIIGDAAGIPLRFVNGELDSSLSVNEVKFEVGVAPISNHPSGEVRYFTPELLGSFGGELRIIENIATDDSLSVDDELEADLDQSELDIQRDTDPEHNEEVSVDEGNAVDEEEQHQEQEPIVEPSLEEIESFILEKKPTFDDIPYDFPALVAKRKSGITWGDIAVEIKEPSTKISSAYSRYKKKVKDIMMGGAA